MTRRLGSSAALVGLLGTQRCRGPVTSRLYRFGWPSKVAWKAGDRTLICYSQTRR